MRRSKTSLFDHFVDEHEQPIWHFETERLRSLGH
jgi:hypothetical protein